MAYFPLYLLQAASAYGNAYGNVEAIDQRLNDKGIVMSDGGAAYIRKVLTFNLRALHDA